MRFDICGASEAEALGLTLASGAQLAKDVQGMEAENDSEAHRHWQ